MPDTSARFGKLGKNLMNDNVDIKVNGIKVIFLKSSFLGILDLDTMETITHLVLGTHESSGSPYTAGGLLVDAADITETYVSVNKNTRYSCPDQVLDNATIDEVKYIVFAERVTGYLLSIQTLETAKSPVGQQLKINIASGAAQGFLTI